ncbi:MULTISPECIES: DUF4164 domain-containing protein [Kaistia]|mgnify:FL=1|uniref:DUF4164 domain-containing protein n=1 Tax=Kaistia nematophila TaxID=2994654 RepID=A0A9X3E539_9HYPH|nr:DUF4164 domain-containing protein [Kaistia nematophila]MBN9025019.1 DUF4164 domain-containing protein [Hyphomicrobiales bacterium]MBN9059910.1 DUF4164 domain-containing protein [Hyphomicrobiales bacterium]MCX5571283.1 DUF4164 domain-containing protein [Kaistia nematophila]
MRGASPIDGALRRLSAALDGLEGAVDRRLNAGARLGEIEIEMQRIGLDRSRLAQSVDAAEARSERLEEANKEVSRRLVAAMETIRSVLERNDG